MFWVRENFAICSQSPKQTIQKQVGIDGALHELGSDGRKDCVFCSHEWPAASPPPLNLLLMQLTCSMQCDIIHISLLTLDTGLI